MIKTRLICMETGKKTGINISNTTPYEIDEIIDTAANRLLRREPDFRDCFVSVRAENMRAKICRGAGELTEFYNEYRTFRIQELTE